MKNRTKMLQSKRGGDRIKDGRGKVCIRPLAKDASRRHSFSLFGSHIHSNILFPSSNGVLGRIWESLRGAFSNNQHLQRFRRKLESVFISSIAADIPSPLQISNESTRNSGGKKRATADSTSNKSGRGKESRNGYERGRVDMPIVRIQEDRYLALQYYIPQNQKVWIDVECEKPVNVYILPEYYFNQFQSGQIDKKIIKTLRLNGNTFFASITLEWEPGSNFRLIISNIKGNGENAAFFRVTNVFP